MGMLKNMIRTFLLSENLDNMADVRIHNYQGVISALQQLEAERPNGGIFKAGGIRKRVLLGVPAIGPKSAHQDIPRGVCTPGASPQWQFTDLKQSRVVTRTEGGVRKIFSSVRMRQLSCHICDC